MTEIQALHHLDEMDAVRREFQAWWDGPEGWTKLKTCCHDAQEPPARQIAWRGFLKGRETKT